MGGESFREFTVLSPPFLIREVELQRVITRLLLPAELSSIENMEEVLLPRLEVDFGDGEDLPVPSKWDNINIYIYADTSLLEASLRVIKIKTYVLMEPTVGFQSSTHTKYSLIGS